jgi:hypothetical protein
VDENTIYPPGSSLLAWDTVYYPGVLESIKEGLNRTRVLPRLANELNCDDLDLAPTKEHCAKEAYLVFNAYTRKNGHYQLDYDEGFFDIKDGVVTMCPTKNSVGYTHPIFDWEYEAVSHKVEDGFIYDTLYCIPTSPFSSIVLVHVSYDEKYVGKNSVDVIKNRVDTGLRY